MIWECEYRDQLNEDTDMNDFVIAQYPQFYKNNRQSVSQQTILDAVVDETLFGFVEVDISVPDSWDQVNFKPTTQLTPYEYFEEMSPLFCTTQVDIDSVGTHMQDHVRECKLSTKPRTLLVGGMKAECILLASPLLNGISNTGSW